MCLVCLERSLQIAGATDVQSKANILEKAPDQALFIKIIRAIISNEKCVQDVRVFCKIDA